MNILVTGSEGVVGSALMAEFSNRGIPAYGCDLQHSDEEYGTYFRADVADYHQLEKIISTAIDLDVRRAAQEEIAEQLDLKIGTVKSRIFFTRKKLMESLADYKH